MMLLHESDLRRKREIGFFLKLPLLFPVGRFQNPFCCFFPDFVGHG